MKDKDGLREMAEELHDVYVRVEWKRDLHQ